MRIRNDTGWTRTRNGVTHCYVGIDTLDGYLEGWVATEDHGADLDGEFVIETDDGKFIVNGWMLDDDAIEQLNQ